jgi:dTDP-4-amino-4,6-dideoxygalactose transaminase
MNMDETLIEGAVNDKTKAIVPVHYAGVSCDMDRIMEIANKNGLYVIEDAAQAMMSQYKGSTVGLKGHMATYSFHETKNYTSGGEGGLLIINDEDFFERAEIIREKGTNRSSFFRGQVDKYTWVDIGSSYLPGELQAAHLYSQLLQAEEIRDKRVAVWERYAEGLKSLQDRNLVELMAIPETCEHNGHLFFLKCKTAEYRDELIKYLKDKGVTAVFHYIPLHSSPAGEKYGEFIGEDIHTTDSSMRLVRLPIFYNLLLTEVDYIVDAILTYYE